MDRKFGINNFIILLRKHQLKILLITALSTILVVLAMFVLFEPQYTSRAQLLTVQDNIGQSEEDTVIELDEIQLNIHLVSTFNDIIFGDRVLSEVSEQLDNKYSVVELRGALTLRQSTDSQTFYLSANTNSPQNSQEIVNTLIRVFQQTLEEIYDTSMAEVFVVSDPSFQPKPVSPSLSRFIFIGLVIGYFASVITILCIELSDTRLKHSDDLRELGITEIGSINVFSRKVRTKSRLNNYYDKQQKGR